MHLVCTRISTMGRQHRGRAHLHDNRTSSPLMLKCAATSLKATCATNPQTAKKKREEEEERKEGQEWDGDTWCNDRLFIPLWSVSRIPNPIWIGRRTGMSPPVPALR